MLYLIQKNLTATVRGNRTFKKIYTLLTSWRALDKNGKFNRYIKY
jgi:hypothetical protein